MKREKETEKKKKEGREERKGTLPADKQGRKKGMLHEAEGWLPSR